MDFLKRENLITPIIAYLALVLASGILHGCQHNPNSTAGESSGGPQNGSRTQLSDEEFELLESRQTHFVAAGSAFVEAAAAWEAKALTAGNQSTSDAGRDSMPRESMNGMTLGWMTVLRDIENSAIGYAWEGRHGELLYCSGRSTGAVRITRNGEELELLKPDANGIPTFIGVVRESGDYIPITRFRSSMTSVKNAPKHWGSSQTGRDLKALEPDSPILCAKRSKPVRPRGALGWLFPTSDGDLVCAPENIDPIENVLWVVPNGTGLDIVHSGPEYRGYYARVSPDCKVTFQVPFKSSANTDWSEAIWHIVDRSQQPAFHASALSGHVLPARLEDPNNTLRINSEGTLTLLVPPIAD